MSVTVTASFLVRSGREQDADAALEQMIVATHAEPGCERYALHRDVAEPRHLVFVERWTSRADHERHDAAPHVERFRRLVDELFEEPPIVSVLEPLPHGDPVKGRL
jgi:quinol monooxygenase YgiN